MEYMHKKRFSSLLSPIRFQIFICLGANIGIKGVLAAYWEIRMKGRHIEHWLYWSKAKENVLGAS